MTLIVRSSRALVGTIFQSADIVIENGIIVEIAELGSFENCHDFGNAFLVPGFVDLHSDAVEKEIEPRPGASFPIENAIVELDKKLALCGITTMFHAIAFFEEEVAGLRGCREAAELVRAVVGANRDGLGVDNLVHARYEVTAFTALPLDHSRSTSRAPLALIPLILPVGQASGSAGRNSISPYWDWRSISVTAPGKA